jgi:hypothetical protein
MSVWLFKILGTEMHSGSLFITLASTLKQPNFCVISAFRRSVNGIFFFWYVTQRRFVVSYRHFGTICRSQLQASSSLTAWSLKKGPLGCPELGN